MTQTPTVVVIEMLVAGMLGSLVFILWRVASSRGAMRRLAAERGWEYFTQRPECEIRAAQLIPDRDGPRGKWVTRSYRTRSIVSGQHDGVAFDLCHLRVDERTAFASVKWSWLTACQVRLPQPLFAGDVFACAAPRGRSVVPAVAAQASVLGPVFAAYHGRSDLKLAWWSPLVNAPGSSLAALTGVDDRIVPLDKGATDPEFTQRVVIVADDAAWAAPLLCPAAQQALLSHDRDWYFLLYAVRDDLMLLAVPRPGISDNRYLLLHSSTELAALVELATKVARAVSKGA